jgi:hypothetical protein
VQKGSSEVEIADAAAPWSPASAKQGDRDWLFLLAPTWKHKGKQMAKWIAEIIHRLKSFY